MEQLSGKETLKSLECFNMGIRRQDRGLVLQNWGEWEKVTPYSAVLELGDSR